MRKRHNKPGADLQHHRLQGGGSPGRGRVVGHVHWAFNGTLRMIFKKAQQKAGPGTPTKLDQVSWAEAYRTYGSTVTYPTRDLPKGRAMGRRIAKE